jgi:2'-5' RNA ligase
LPLSQWPRLDAPNGGALTCWTMRLFVAIELPDDVRAALAAVQDRLRDAIPDGVSWVKPANLHMTMKFLGEVPDQRVPAIVDALRAITWHGALRLSTGPAAVMPPRGPGRVLVVDVEGEVDGLESLAATIDDACATAGFEREGHPFRPHLTLGRLRPPRRLPPNAIANVDAPAVPVTVTEFVLIQSQLNPTGSIYTRAAVFPLERSS